MRKTTTAGTITATPKAYTSDERICTMYSWDSMNDTCFYSSRNPHWTVAGYEEDSDNYPSLDIDDRDRLRPGEHFP